MNISIMANFNKTELKIIRILLDNEGHANWDLEELLDMSPPNMSRYLKKLEGKKVISWKSRLTTRDHSRKNKQIKKSRLAIFEIYPSAIGIGNDQSRYSEHAWYLEPTIEVFNDIVNALIDNKSIFSRFKIDFIKKSSYFKLIAEKYGDKSTISFKKFEDALTEDFLSNKNRDIWDY